MNQPDFQDRSDPSPACPPPANGGLRPMILSDLEDGTRARLYSTDLRCEDCDLLNALGMTEQCEMRICQVGNPCIVQVDSTRIGLSPDVAKRIYVVPHRADTPK